MIKNIRAPLLSLILVSLVTPFTMHCRDHDVPRADGSGQVSPAQVDPGQVV